MGGLFAATRKAPGVAVPFQGRSDKSYRRMGNRGAMQQGAADHYVQEYEASIENLPPERIEGRVPYKGPVGAVIHQTMGVLRLDRVHVASAAFVQITKEAPHYHIDRISWPMSKAIGALPTPPCPRLWSFLSGRP